MLRTSPQEARMHREMLPHGRQTWSWRTLFISCSVRHTCEVSDSIAGSMSLAPFVGLCAVANASRSTRAAASAKSPCRGSSPGRSPELSWDQPTSQTFCLHVCHCLYVEGPAPALARLAVSATSAPVSLKA